MRRRRYSQIQWGQTGRHRQASTCSGATPFREGGSPCVLLFGHLFHTALRRTLLELDRTEVLARAFLLHRAKRGDAFAARLLWERYRVRVATGEEVRHENQRLGLTARQAGRGTGVSHAEPPRPAVRGLASRRDTGVAWAGARGL